MQEETESGKAPKPVSVGGLGNVPVAEQQNEYHGRTSRTENRLSSDVNCSFFACLFLTHSDRVIVAKLDFLRWPGADKVHLYPSHIRDLLSSPGCCARDRSVAYFFLLEALFLRHCVGGKIKEFIRFF